MLLWRICFNVRCVGFGLLLIFQAFQEEYIRLLMTVIKYTEKKPCSTCYLHLCLYIFPHKGNKAKNTPC